MKQSIFLTSLLLLCQSGLFALGEKVPPFFQLKVEEKDNARRMKGGAGKDIKGRLVMRKLGVGSARGKGKHGAKPDIGKGKNGKGGFGKGKGSTKAPSSSTGKGKGDSTGKGTSSKGKGGKGGSSGDSTTLRYVLVRF